MVDEKKTEEEMTPQEQENENNDTISEIFEESPREAEDLLAQKDAEMATLQDRLMRLAAEMENTRKRLEREKSEGICFANESLMRDLLPVLDNLERALEHADNESSSGGLLEGVHMTRKVFLSVLNKYGCKPFDSEGETFDPNFHEAMMQEETLDHPDNTVIKEFQKGYTLNDRLLRPAMVIVAKAPK